MVVFSAFRRRLFVVLAWLVVLQSGHAGEERTWTGGGANGNWNNTANWLNATPPTAGDSVVFAGTTNLATTNNIGALSLASLRFDAGVGTVTVAGSALDRKSTRLNSSHGA